MEHITIKNNGLFCSNCGKSLNLGLSIEISKFTSKVKEFNKLHANCEKTWKPAVVDMTLPLNDRAFFWYENGERGASSMAIWNCFMREEGKRTVDHPYDPDDFKRCYKLLQIVPEWKEQISRLKTLSIQWSNLADNWDKLTEMFEKNEREGWRNYRQVGMYEFMQELIK
jgi:hypothetical protein